jgi:hypothetical protein
VVSRLRYGILGVSSFTQPLIFRAISRIKTSADDATRTAGQERLLPLAQKEQKTMTSTPSRRDMVRIAAAGAAGSSLTLTALPAEAFQGNMERALSALGAAMQFLQASAPNKGGHRERAMRLIEHAMGEVQTGINFAYQHGGGGY